MAFDIFIPPINPDHEMQVEPSEAILESNFGEYTQRAIIGLNAQRNNINPQWTNLYESEATSILTFLKSVGRTKAFFYQAPKEPMRAYVCDGYSYKWKKGVRCDIGPCNFIETRTPEIAGILNVVDRGAFYGITNTAKLISFAQTGLELSFNTAYYRRGIVANVSPDAIGGWTFTRAGVGSSQTVSGNVTSFATGVPKITDKGILIEGAHTNLLLRSQEFDNAAWGKSNVTVTTDNIVAPDGSMTADKIAATASTFTTISQFVPGSGNAANNTVTIFAKKGSGATDANSFLLRNDTTATNLIGVTINYDTGALTYSVGSSGASVVQLANGWWRISLTPASGVSAGDQLRFYAGFSGNSETAGEYYYGWGAQLESGNLATSYIPTTSAQVTSAQDVASVTQTIASAADFTLYGEVEFPVGPYAVQTVFDAHDGTNNSGLYLQRNAAGVMNFTLRSGGLLLSGSAGANKAGARTVKWAIVRASGTYYFYVDGYLMDNQTVAGVPDLTTHHQGQRRAGAAVINAYIRKFVYIPFAFTAVQGQSVTTPTTGTIAAEATPVSAVSLLPRSSVYGLTSLAQGIAFENTGYELLFSDAYFRIATATAATFALTTGASFSRGSVAIADYRGRNLFTYSQEFDHANWTKSNLTVSGNVIMAPDGTMTADKLVSANATGAMVAGQSITFALGVPVTVSCYFKPISGEVRWVYFRCSVNGAEIVSFDLTNGVAGGVQSPWSGARVESVGNGWFRCSARYTSPTNVTGLMRIGIEDADQSASYTGNGVRGVYAWGAQAETGATTNSYFMTGASASLPGIISFATGVARVTDRGLLVEEARTNKYNLYNANPIAAPSPGFSGGTCTCTLVDDSAALAAAGLNSICTSGQVYKITFTGVSYWLIVFAGQSGNTNPHISSAYVRAGTGTQVVAAGFDNSEAGLGWTVGTTYQRIHSLPCAPSSSARQAMFSGGGTGEVYIVLPQLEEGVTTSAPIVVAGATATRALDVPTETTAIPANQDFTIFGETDFDRASINEQVIFEMHDGSNNNSISLRRNWNGVVYPMFKIGGVVQTGFSGASRGGSRRTKWCLVRSGTSYSFYSDGYLIETRTVASVPTMTTTHLGQQRDGSFPLNAYVRKHSILFSAVSSVDALAMTIPHLGLPSESVAVTAARAFVRPELYGVTDAAQAASFMNSGVEIIPSQGYHRSGLLISTTLSGLTGLSYTRSGAGTAHTKSRNMLAYSEAFSISPWTLTAGGGTSTLTEFAATTPIGSANGTKVSEAANTGLHGISTALITSPLGQYVFSVYVKAAERTRVFIRSTDASTGGSFAYFDLATGTVSAIDNTGKGSWGNMTARIQDVGGGWYRISATQTRGASTNMAWGVHTTSASGTSSFLGTAGSGVYMWGAQLEEGAIPEKYFPTIAADTGPVVVKFAADTPRITSKGLLIEEARTNLLLQSEAFDNATYWNVTNSSVTANNTAAPDGTTTADRLTDDGTNGIHSIFQVFSVTSGQAYAYSVYLKNGDRRYAQLFFGSAGHGGTAYANFDLQTGVIGTVGAGTTAFIETMANGWYRCTIVAAATATTASGSGQVGLITSSTSVRAENYTGTGSFLYAWGAQAEAATNGYASSYIPTTGATATRGVSNCYLPATIASSGTLLARTNGTSHSSTRAPVAINASGTYAAPHSFLLRMNGGANIEAGGNNTAISKGLSLNVQNRQLITGTTYVGGTGAVSVTGNNLAPSTGTSDFTSVGSNRIQIGNLNSAGIQSYNGYIQSIVYLPFALSDTVLQAQTAT